MKKKIESKIVAEGEHTGHAHVLDENATVWEDKGVITFQNDIESKITHEEHHEITIPVSPTGEWEVGRVKEYDHFWEESRQVRD